MTTSTSRPDGAFAYGGPMDGSRLGEASAEEFEVTMADRTRHRYVRTAVRTAEGFRYDHAGRL